MNLGKTSSSSRHSELIPLSNLMTLTRHDTHDRSAEKVQLGSFEFYVKSENGSKLATDEFLRQMVDDTWKPELQQRSARVRRGMSPSSLTTDRENLNQEVKLVSVYNW